MKLQNILSEIPDVINGLWKYEMKVEYIEWTPNILNERPNVLNATWLLSLLPPLSANASA